ncbi:MAG TPA: histidinol dehydrogenase, partial [Phycisphaerales bacterium]|nr:histidinol dehydrogenase [Phycisphaerales bacterium]
MLAAEASFEPGSDGFNAVLQIVQGVIHEGDAALVDYTRRFDAPDFNAERLRVPEQEMRDAHAQTDAALLDSLRRAIDNVRAYQSAIFVGDKDKTDSPGIRYTPIRRVGVCVPGASAPLPSTVIMTAVPAQVAGVREIAVVSPPRYQGTIHPVILAVCHELGIREVYRVGGAQAVAALAAGTRTIPRVDKIVGPGNTWV